MVKLFFLFLFFYYVQSIRDEKDHFQPLFVNWIFTSKDIKVPNFLKGIKKEVREVRSEHIKYICLRLEI